MANWRFGDGQDENATIGGIGLISGAQSKQGIYETSTTQNYPLGHRMVFTDGRVFRYAHFVAAGTAASVQAQDMSVSAVAPIDGKATAAAIGATQVTLTDTDTFGTGDAADVYAGGYLHTEDDAGEGYAYRIKSNAVGTSGGVMVLDLYDGLVVALTTDSDVAITGNMWKNLRDASTTDPLVAGVAVRAHAAAAYGWVQTWGPATVLIDVVANANAAIGQPVYLSDGDTGQVHPIAGVASNTTFNAGDVDTPFVGYLLTAGTDAAHAGVYLQICP